MLFLEGWIKEIKVLDHLTIPLIKIRVEVEGQANTGPNSSEGALWTEEVWLDVSMENPQHSGLASAVSPLENDHSPLCPYHR